jgi:hypothetical protein
MDLNFVAYALDTNTFCNWRGIAKALVNWISIALPNSLKGKAST